MPADGQTPRQAPGLRIGVDLRSLVGSVTGIGRYTSALLAALMPAPGFRYVGLAHRQPGEAGSALLDAGLAMEVQPAPLGVLWQQLRLPRRLQRGDLDLFWSPLLTLPRHPPIPSVVTVHDLTPVLYPETQRWKLRLSVLPFLERTLESANTIVTGSHATADELRFHFPGCKERLEVVHHGVAETFQPGEPNTVDATRRRLGAPEGYILYVGSIEPRKNLSRLIDAWEALREEDPHTPPLLLAGPYGWHSRALLRRIERLRGDPPVAGRAPLRLSLAL
jgi:glycosyltransferase involved in cell wall biosynthesis